MVTDSTTRPVHARWFYSIASAVLLVLTFIGFKLFYLEGQAFPGRPLTPPIRTLLIIHGVVMTAWMLLAVVQAMLMAAGRRRVHMALGFFATALAVAVVVFGYMTAINGTRLTPPDMKLFGLAPKEFLAVPLSGVATFAGFFSMGLLNRRRPDVHRPMMFMASLSVVSAALGRMPALNNWYAGTVLEHWFSAFLSTVILGALLLLLKWGLERRPGRWFAGTFAAFVVACVVTSLIAKTGAWVQFASFLIR
ncbi:MAG: hypothetical protein FJ405_09050 [Verrucomicrobia bacterium]|nr:hypothetical protein [Verrucomicrobiota bacterium]